MDFVTADFAANVEDFVAADIAADFAADCRGGQGSRGSTTHFMQGSAYTTQFL